MCLSLYIFQIAPIPQPGSAFALKNRYKNYCLNRSFSSSLLVVLLLALALFPELKP